MSDTAAVRSASSRPQSLRSRWNRSFLLLVVVIAASGLAGFFGAGRLIAAVRSSAVQVEEEATNIAVLRALIVDHSVVVSSPTSVLQRARQSGMDTAIRTAYVKMIPTATSAGRAPLEQSFDRWNVLVAALGPLERPASLSVRGAAVSAGAPTVLALLERAGSVSRAAVRVELARGAGRIRFALGVLAGFELLAIALAVRLARRLSAEVLRPVARLRASANHLAAGELDHRVIVDRSDELGELASSFNAMADAIAGSQRTLTQAATTDFLSGLPNRAAFRARLSDELGSGATISVEGGRWTDPVTPVQAVLFVDLDDFKDVNDSLGHGAGDQLLRVVGDRLRTVVRPGDLVARLGGDEFALLLDDLSSREAAMVIAGRVVEVLSAPVQISGTATRVGASVGLAMRRPCSTVDELMREADVAMYAAKAKGKNRVESYDADLDGVAVERHLLRAELASAVANRELVLDYQPVADLATGAPLGIEALVRWQHPTRGLLPPLTFIDVAETTGAIVGVGAWVLETAVWQLRTWQHRHHLPHLWMSVNVSVRQLEEPGFADYVRRVLSEAGVDPGSLIVEVTESILAEPLGRTASTLSALRYLGVRVALDDFGTGFSSISYLRQLPVDVLKIDRSFVSGCAVDRPSTALLEAIVAMAKRLDLEVIPEGIEDHDQLVRLRGMGCEMGQGFWLSRPVGADRIDAMLASRSKLAHVQV